MKTLKNWTLLNADASHVTLQIDHRYRLALYVLEKGLFRVAISRNTGWALDKTWSIAPEKDVPWEGRSRDDLSGFSLPGYSIEETDECLVIATDTLRVTVHQPLWLEWHYRDTHGEWQLLASDRSTSAYLINPHGDGVAHYQHRLDGDRYYGLGEKAGPLQRTGKRYEMRNLDAMGYNAAHTDPLYKHIPFTITKRENVSFGLFYDNLSSCWFGLGNEIDNYHRPYRRWQAEAGDIDYYLFVGERVDITKAFVRLTGKTLFGPKWSLGYSGSTMHYTDAPDAQQQLMNFIRLCKEHAIPCDSFQLSSGYTSINNKRYVFNWNYDKVPQPKALSQAFHDAGLRLAANIKPCLLQDHPRYHEVAEKGLFIRDSETGQPERSSFWDDEGSNLDFTNPDTIAWWQEGVTTQLLEMGIDSTWNDNNEFEVWDSEARCHGFGTSLSGLYNVGHDVGGFSGDRPDPELFVRWVQNGVMHPRFTIHSWNDDHTVNEPWMYPAITPAIRSAIELRYRLLPWFYTLLWQAHADDEPMLRPTFLDHEHDAQTFEECDEFMLGKDLLVASVVEPGARERTLWLPANAEGWYDFYTGVWYSGGQWITLAAPLETLPLLVRAGAGLPLSARLAHTSPAEDTTRELKLFPLKGAGTRCGLLFEDDGESWGYQEGNALWLEWEMACEAATIRLTISTRGDYRPAWRELTVTLPPDEHRQLLINGEAIRCWQF